jgi:hypothetical protein
MRDRHQRISEDLLKEIEDIKIQRIKMGIDKKFISNARITSRIVKEPEWGSIKTKIIQLPRDMNLDKLRRIKK